MDHSVLELSSLSKGGIHVDEKGGITIPDRLGVDYRLCRVGGNEFKINYLKIRWQYFNKHLFGGVMTEPEFTISNKVKALGVWYAGRKTIEMGKRMFLLPHDRETLNTFVHEMCHQYVSQHVHPSREEMGPTGHGSAWQDTMAAIGLPIDDKFRGPASDLWSTRKVLEVEDKTERLKNSKRVDVSSDQYRVMRYINPETGTDCPVILHPSMWNSKNTDPLDEVLIGNLLMPISNKRKDADNLQLRKAVYVPANRVVLPGHLMIKTKAYRRAQEIIEEIKRDGMPLIMSS
jgi:predicted SprT family Zn-dependent metalloprotease